MPIAYSAAILVLFYVLLLLEFFVPSGGILGIAAAAAAFSAVAIASTHSANAGLTMFTIIATTTPLVFLLMIRAWPRTRIGRQILNRQPGDITASTAPDRMLPDGRPLAELVQRIGVAKTNLLPSGLVQIDGERLDAVSVGMPIDAGTRVIVTKIQAGKIQVRPALDHETDAIDPTQSPRSPAVLDTDLSSLDLDEF